MPRNKRVALITDTTCDIPRDIVKQYGILMVPQYVIWRSEEYNDLTEIDAATFYHRLPRDSEHPKTSRPTVPDYLNCIDQAIQDGAEEAVVIVVSEQLSGSVASGRLAQQESRIPFHLEDAKSVSMGLGWQVLAAARVRDQGGGVEEMLEAARAVRKHLRAIFTVNTLEYLHRGGRIGGAAKWVGTALDLKPSLYVDHESGTIQPGERIRTRKKALNAIYDKFFEGYERGQRMRVAVAHGACLEEAEGLLNRIQAEWNPVDLILTHASPAIGVHGGPGILGLCGYVEG